MLVDLLSSGVHDFAKILPESIKYLLFIKILAAIGGNVQLNMLDTKHRLRVWKDNSTCIHEGWLVIR